MYKLLNILLCLMLLTFSTMAQNEDEDNIFNLHGLEYGFNFGVLFPNNQIANYYNGEPQNTHSLERAIYQERPEYNGYTYFNPNYDTIRNKIGYEWTLKEYPQRMSYKTAMNVGFHAKYMFEQNFAIFLEFNYSKLTAKDKFSIQPEVGASISNPIFFDLVAKESRVDFNLGVFKAFGKPQRFNPFLELALNLNNTKTLSADAVIFERNYSYLNQYNEQYSLRDDGIGNGYLIGGGYQIIFSPSIVLHTGINFCYKKIHLGSNKDYNLNTVLYIRVLFHSLISTEPDEN